MWQSIFKEYRSDMGKYADDKDKPHIITESKSVLS